MEMNDEFINNLLVEINDLIVYYELILIKNLFVEY